MVWYLYLSESPFSHLETVCLTMCSLMASSSWDNPLALRKYFRFSLSMTLHPSRPFITIIREPPRCFKQRNLTFHYLEWKSARWSRPMGGGTQKRKTRLTSCLRLSKKWHSHFFEKNCTQGGPRFLAEKSARLAREVSFPTRMSPEMTGPKFIPSPAGAGTPCRRAFLTN